MDIIFVPSPIALRNRLILQPSDLTVVFFGRERRGDGSIIWQTIGQNQFDKTAWEPASAGSIRLKADPTQQRLSPKNEGEGC
jgi:hypothetical protein